MLLLFADRVDVVEGLAQDARRSHRAQAVALVGIGVAWRLRSR